MSDRFHESLKITEVVRPERLVCGHGEEGEPGYHRATVRFRKEGHGTKLTMQLSFKTPSEREEVVKKHGAVEGLNQTLGRLEAMTADALPS